MDVWMYAVVSGHLYFCCLFLSGVGAVVVGGLVKLI